MGGISAWQLVIVAVIVVLLFGTKKLRGLGGDLGSAIKGFKEAVSEDKKPSDEVEEVQDNAILKDQADESQSDNKR